ncbi:ketopantoate reductase family protein [Paenibacillus thermotolerans]|uniref:ketopantoate reductase family protein n=1 Tax=Paenibacillus thermotolerans TaxID=3027807 RepID=UPI0023674CD7|nr:MULTISPECIES: 2-dehydropantoate 2-reductase [unclassified Paenibacillus]
MNMLIIGAGSLGLLYAARLAGANGSGLSLRVDLLTHGSEQAERIRRSGIQILEGKHAARVRASNAESFGTAADEAPSGIDWDWIMLMVKQTHIDSSMLQRLAGMAKGRAKLVCFQNGVGHLERLAEAGIPAERLYAAVTTEGAKKTAPNEVRHTGRGVTLIGSVHAAGTYAEAKPLAEVLSAAGFRAEATDRIGEAMYRKLLVNSVINPLTAILKIKNGTLLSSAYYMDAMNMLYREACDVLGKEGLPITDELWEHLVDVCRKTSDNSSSMLQDVLAGRETEIEWINGSIVRLAAKHQISVPAHRIVYNMVKGTLPG